MPKPKFINKECKTHGNTEFVLEGRGYYRCKKCRSENIQKRRKKIKEKLVSAFGGKCIECGYSRCIENLDFHHLDPTKKDFGISSKGLTRSFAKALEEAKKCILVCCRCHGEIHAGLLDPADFINKSSLNIEIVEPSKDASKCPSCDNGKYRYASSCKTCYKKNRTTKIVWPTLEVLTTMVKNFGFLKTGKILGVSDNSVRKRIKKLTEVC